MTGGDLGLATEDTLVFNGIDAASGDYLLPPMSSREVSEIASGRGSVEDPDHVKELRWWHHRIAEASFGPTEGVDPLHLDQTGWAVVFGASADPAVKAALRPLLEHRRAQAARSSERYFRELEYRPGETKQQFLAHHGAGPGPADPDNVPYYLLLVGGPDEIPYDVQYQLDVQYAVGRLHFDTPGEYANYARSVVAAEAADFTSPKRAAFFAAQNPDDRATALSAGELVAPLADHLEKKAGDWEVRSFLGEAAAKDRLVDLVTGDEPVSLLFTASHGVGFPSGHPLQLRSQGALLCQDWPGPLRWKKPLTPQQYLGADDVADERGPHGLISFHFACFGAGTPQWDAFGAVGAGAGAGARRQLAPRPFVAALPKRLLGHPNGGALAVVGHVDRAWGYSFFWPEVGRQSQVYESCLERLLAGHPIGSAFEYMNERYAELSSDFHPALENIQMGMRPDPIAFSGLWTALNDARGFAILGDPAVRLLGRGDTPSTPAATAGPVSAPAPLTAGTPAAEPVESAAADPAAAGAVTEPDLQAKLEAVVEMLEQAQVTQQKVVETLQVAAAQLRDAIARSTGRP